MTEPKEPWYAEGVGCLLIGIAVFLILNGAGLVAALAPC